MPTLDEIFNAKSSAAANAATGVDVLSENQEITFNKYVRVVLPSDGFVFWVKASLLSQGALLNAMLLNKVPLNFAAKYSTSATNTLTVQGSFHWDAVKRQEKELNYTAAQAVFTALAEVNDLKAVAPGTCWIAQQNGMTFAFSSQSFFYRQMDLWHYRGFAVYSDLLTQVVDTMGQANVAAQIVSNSLPIWMSFNTYSTFYGIQRSPVPVYPSFLVPENLPPPYASIHVVPESTIGLASAPRLGKTYDHSQLCAEDVEVTLTGARNSQAMDFLDFVEQFTLDTDQMGIMNIPVPRDDKRPQPELGIIAQRKTTLFRVSYHQRQARDIARQLILHSIPTFTFQ